MKILLFMMRSCVLGLLFYISCIATARAQVVITEVHWAGSNVSSADEWLELYATEEVDLSGWKLTTLSSSGEKIMVEFETGTILSVDQIYLISNYGAAGSALSIEPDLVTNDVSLPNSKLELKLYNADGQIIDQVDDGSGAPFAGSSGDVRASMERINIEGAGTDAENWKTAAVSLNLEGGVLGSPGIFIKGIEDEEDEKDTEESSSSSSKNSSISSSSSEIIESSSSSSFYSFSSFQSFPEQQVSLPQIPKVYITEVMSNPSGSDDTEWIELTNMGSGSVQTGGWRLSKEHSSQEFLLPDLTLHPFASVSFRKTQSDISLSNKGGVILLQSGSVLIDRLEYFETASDVSYGRDPDNMSNTRAFCISTEGSFNTNAPIDPIINIQSGRTWNRGPVTINVQAQVQKGSDEDLVCYWDYGDGTVFTQCNPPPYTFEGLGTYKVTLRATSFCGNTIKRELEIRVLKKKVEKDLALDENGNSSSSFYSSYSFQSFKSEAIKISEVYPSPNTGEQEWIEFYNTTEQDIDLAGWILDDVADAGSKPVTLSSLLIPAQSYAVLIDPAISLNNSGDDVILSDPTSNVIHQISYESIPKGSSWTAKCVSKNPTPGIENQECAKEEQSSSYSFLSSKSSSSIKKQTTKTTSIQRVSAYEFVRYVPLPERYKAILHEEESEAAVLSGSLAGLQVAELSKQRNSDSDHQANDNSVSWGVWIAMLALAVWKSNIRLNI